MGKFADAPRLLDCWCSEEMEILYSGEIATANNRF